MAFSQDEIAEIVRALQEGRPLRKELLERLERGERVGNGQAASPGDSMGLGSLIRQLPSSAKLLVKTELYSNIFGLWACIGCFGTLGIMVILGLVVGLGAKNPGKVVANFGLLGLLLGLIVVGPALGAWKTYQYWKRDRTWRRTVAI